MRQPLLIVHTLISNKNYKRSLDHSGKHTETQRLSLSRLVTLKADPELKKSFTQRPANLVLGAMTYHSINLHKTKRICCSCSHSGFESSRDFLSNGLVMSHVCRRLPICYIHLRNKIHKDNLQSLDNLILLEDSRRIKLDSWFLPLSFGRQVGGGRAWGRMKGSRKIWILRGCTFKRSLVYISHCDIQYVHYNYIHAIIC